MKLKSLVGKEVGEVEGDQFSTQRCYMDSTKKTNMEGLTNLDRPKCEKSQDKKIKAIELDKFMLELHVQLEDELMLVELIPNVCNRTTIIKTQLEHHMAK